MAARRPGCEVLVLSIFGDEANVLAAIDAGAGGYLLKDGSLESIREHLACLKSGGLAAVAAHRPLIRRTCGPAAVWPAALAGGLPCRAAPLPPTASSTCSPASARALLCRGGRKP